MALRDLVVIENATIDSMAADSRYVAVVPCLARFRQATALGAKSSATCSRCAKTKAQRTVTAAYNEAKQCLASLDADSKQALGRLLNARQIRVQFMQGNGQGVQFTVKLQA